MSNPNQKHPPINLEDFSKKSLTYYEQIKKKLEKEAMSKYVAVDYETSKYWIGETASDALSKAKAQFPDKIFYLFQVGSLTTFSVQSIASNDPFGKRSMYGLNWAH